MSLVGEARIIIGTNRDACIALVESVHRILSASTCLLASHFSSKVDSRFAKSNVRFFIVAHLEEDWLSFSIYKSSDRIPE